MNEHRGFEELMRVAREDDAAERQRWDERWDRLAAGVATAEEVAELQALAASSAEAAAAWQAFAPLGAGFETKVAAALSRQREAETVARPRVARPQQAGPEPARVLPFRRRRLAYGGLAALAAALAFVLLRTPASLPPLPAYELALAGVAAERSEQVEVPAAAIELRAGARFELQLTPETAASGPFEVRFHLERAGALAALELAAERSQTGSLRVACTVGEAGCLPAADGVLWVVLGRPGALPAAAELAALAASPEAGADGATWRIWRRTLRAQRAS